MLSESIDTARQSGHDFVPLKTRVEEDVLVYNPQRVLRQLGYGQGRIQTSGDVSYFSYSDGKKFEFRGRMEILVGAERIFSSGLGCEGLMSPEDFVQCVGVLDEFVFYKE